MTFRYIGSKARLADQIIEHVGGPSGSHRFVDLFCGTGAVAAAAAANGWHVHLNDHLHSAVVTAAARLIGPKAVKFHALGGYERTISKLNAAMPRRGFIYREYSPASFDLIGVERRYFSEANAAKIDAVRSQIREWRDEDLVTGPEETLLIADLISATNRIANIAGTYGCFMRKWQAKALTPVLLVARKLAAFEVQVSVSVADASDVEVTRTDTVYMDPPYTKRQYAAYYHLVETIVVGDEPNVSGVAGLRPWQAKSSPFCYKNKALNAITRLVDGIPAERIYLSYSDNAHVGIETLAGGLETVGNTNAILLKDVGRYRPNRVATLGRSQVKEYLFEVERAALEVAA
jgi:adenine-specific DNA-methyltransferase